MEKSTSRRNWLKTGLLAAGGLVLAPSLKPKSAKAGVIEKSISKLGQSVLWERNPEYMKAPVLKARLLANENPYGPSESTKKAIAETITAGNRYGHSDSATLIKMIAEKEGVAPENIMLGPGSTDLLEKTAIVLCKDGGNVVSADPTYMSLVNTAQAIGGNWKPIPLTKDYAHDLKAMEAAMDSDTKLIYVCNPNNPLGSITPAKDLKAFCAKVSSKAPVFVDEAYLEFMESYEKETMVGLVAEGKDVIVARTFSKIHGMAGLRIGYIVATESRIKSITSYVRSTMGLCVTSVKGAIASMKETEFLAKCQKLNSEARNYVTKELISSGFKPIPSNTSFVIFPISMPGDDFLKKMFAEGIGIRVFEINNSPWCRVSIGTMDEMAMFTSALKKITSLSYK